MKHFCSAAQAVFVFLALILLAENNYAQKIDTAKDRVKNRHQNRVALSRLGETSQHRRD